MEIKDQVRLLKDKISQETAAIEFQKKSIREKNELMPPLNSSKFEPFSMQKTMDMLEEKRRRIGKPCTYKKTMHVFSNSSIHFRYCSWKCFY